MPGSKKKTVELYYDVISPYTWFAFEALCRYRTKWNIDLKLKPFFLGGVMQGSGNKPPAMVPNKGAYMVHDVERLGKHYGLPLQHPSDPGETILIKGSLMAMRLLTAVDMMDPSYTEALSREIWMRVWSRDQDITLPESLAEAGKRAGLSDKVVKEMLAKTKDTDVKNRLKQHTTEALDHGAFGSPTMIVHDGQGNRHHVFGSDRMHIIADLLGEVYVGPLNELASKL